MNPPFRHLANTSNFPHMQKLARIGTGYAMITVGTIMIFTPGPGLITIVGGLAVLQDDVVWAGRAADWLRKKAGRDGASRRQEGE